MQFRSLIAGLAALAALTTAGLAADFAGGAIKTMDIGGKQVITNESGMTLYTFDKDAVGVTNCYDQCAVNWPPAIASDTAVADGDFTLVERTDGTKMWAYKGWPLYLWKNDQKPGDTTGDMVGEVWHTAVYE